MPERFGQRWGESWAYQYQLMVQYDLLVQYHSSQYGCLSWWKQTDAIAGSRGSNANTVVDGAAMITRNRDIEDISSAIFFFASYFSGAVYILLNLMATD